MTTRAEKIALSFEPKPTTRFIGHTQFCELMTGGLKCDCRGREASLLGHWKWVTGRVGSWQPVDPSEPWIVLKCLGRLHGYRIEISYTTPNECFIYTSTLELIAEGALPEAILSAYEKARNL